MIFAKIFRHCWIHSQNLILFEILHYIQIVGSIAIQKVISIKRAMDDPNFTDISKENLLSLSPYDGS